MYQLGNTSRITQESGSIEPDQPDQPDQPDLEDGQGLTRSDGLDTDGHEIRHVSQMEEDGLADEFRSSFSSDSDTDNPDNEEQDRRAELEYFSRQFNVAIGQTILGSPSFNDYISPIGHPDPTLNPLPPSRPNSPYDDVYVFHDPQSEEGQRILRWIREFFSIPLDESFAHTRHRILTPDEPIYIDLYENPYHWTYDEEIPYIVQPNTLIQTPTGIQMKLPENYGAWGYVKRDFADIWALDMIRDQIASIDWFPCPTFPQSPGSSCSFSSFRFVDSDEEEDGNEDDGLAHKDQLAELPSSPFCSANHLNQVDPGLKVFFSNK